MYAASARLAGRTRDYWNAEMRDADTERYSRNIGLLGNEGQRKVRNASVAVVGLGGLGSHVAQQLAYLGVPDFLLIDPDVVEISNLNRLIGAAEDDVGELKVVVAERLLHRIQSTAAVVIMPSSLEADDVKRAITSAGWIFGCVDNDAARLLLTEVASRHRIPYIDLASDAGGEAGASWFGGRVFVTYGGEHCLSCAGELDQRALAIASMSLEQREADRRIYGIDRAALGASGPMVISVNGTVASLAVTEFIVWIAEIRQPRPHLVYRADLGTVTVRMEPRTGSCYYCDSLWRAGAEVCRE